MKSKLCFTALLAVGFLWSCTRENNTGISQYKWINESDATIERVCLQFVYRNSITDSAEAIVNIPPAGSFQMKLNVESFYTPASGYVFGVVSFKKNDTRWTIRKQLLHGYGSSGDIGDKAELHFYVQKDSIGECTWEYSKKAYNWGKCR